MIKSYYMAYENRYKKVYEAGVEHWGHSPDDKEFVDTLSKWVDKNKLKGKRIIEFACGEGASGVILSKLGCIYNGVDIAPSAISKAKAALNSFPDAKVSLLDIVNEKINENYDAALDVMGLHMLVTDLDRKKYLGNAFSCLKNNSPMLFFRECYRLDAYEGKVTSFDEWKTITGCDYNTPQIRSAKCNGKEVKIAIPLLPARPKTKEGYIAEMQEAGFIVDDFNEIETNWQCPTSVSIFVHKPQ